jgi:hypothetical protein
MLLPSDQATSHYWTIAYKEAKPPVSTKDYAGFQGSRIKPRSLVIITPGAYRSMDSLTLFKCELSILAIASLPRKNSNATSQKFIIALSKPL